MKLFKYLAVRGRSAALAREISAHIQDISDWKTGARPVPIHRCFAIERATNGAVTRKDLRPHDWRDIWPELAEKGE